MMGERKHNRKRGIFLLWEQFFKNAREVCTSISAPGKNNFSRGFTLIELIMVIVIIGILAFIAIPNLTTSSRIANESAAESNLRVISSAIENYATVNNGSYPTAESQLTGATPPYLNQSFCGITKAGYSYSCTLAVDGYTVVATPASCGQTGTKQFTITTGGVFSSTQCGG